MDNISITTAHKKDASALYALLQKTFINYAGSIGQQPNTVPALQDTLQDVTKRIARHTVLLAHQKSTLLGSLCIHHHPGYAYISRFCVDDSTQKKGIGSLLFAQAKEIARKHTAQHIALLTAKNAHKSICFYTKQGFTIHCPLQGKDYPRLLLLYSLSKMDAGASQQQKKLLIDSILHHVA